MENVEWMNKYHVSNVQLSFFETESDYVDYEFIWLIYFNFGVTLEAEKLRKEGLTNA